MGTKLQIAKHKDEQNVAKQLVHDRAVQTPVLSPPARAKKKTPALAENLKLACKFVKIGNFYSLK